MTSKSESTDAPPILWIPGWAVPVYLELEVEDGSDALQRAILGLMQAGVPGLAGSLASQLCLEETIVESVLKTLGDGEWIRWNQAEEMWSRTTKEDDVETQVERRLGWVFWDFLRGRLLPELLLDDHGAGLKASDEIPPANDVLNSDDIPRPKTSHVGAELIPTAEGREFTIRFLRHRGSGAVLENVSGLLRRVSLQRGSRKMRWHPLSVPYRVEPNLGANPSIYCCEPVYDLRRS